MDCEHEYTLTFPKGYTKTNNLQEYYDEAYDTYLERKAMRQFPSMVFIWVCAKCSIRGRDTLAVPNKKIRTSGVLPPWARYKR